MAEPFNVEQFRQQMSGQAPQGQPPMPVQGQPQMVQAAPSPQPYQPPQMPQSQGQPIPYQQQAVQPHYAAEPMAQPMAQPYAPPQHQGQMPQAWTPQHPQMQQPQTPMHHMPQPPVFAPPPGAAHAEVAEEAPKKSRFKLKRDAKVKTPKIKKAKAKKAEEVHSTNTSPAIIFMFGMATGIVCFLVGSMMMSNLLSDKSAKSFRDIERQNAQAQQPVLPKAAQNGDSAAETAAP